MTEPSDPVVFLETPGTGEVPAAAEPAAPEKLPLLQAACERHAALSKLLGSAAESAGDPDFVHDIRVASRRMGEVARLIGQAGGLLDKPTFKAVDASLRSLRQAMGKLRDSDVITEHLKKWRMPGPLRKIARELAEAHAAERPAMEKAAGEQLKSASLTGTMVILARVLEQPPEAAGKVEDRLQDALKGMLKKREKQMRRAFGTAAKKQTPESLHEARIAVKKLRYVLELAQEFTRGAKIKVRELKRFQQLLGDHHDAHVILGELAGRLKKPGEKPAKSVAPAWRTWNRKMDQAQAKRAGQFFVKSYAWINA